MNITKNRNRWFTISGVLLGICVLCIITFGFNLGLDFTGGARWTLEFENKDIQQKEVQDFFKNIETFEQEPLIQMTTENEFLITIEDSSDKEIQNIGTLLKEEFGNFEETSFRKVDSAIGGHFKTKALWALTFALLGIILFVAFAFRRIPKAISQWRFGAVAIAALFHDVLIIAGIFVLLGVFLDIEIGLSFLTALLATLGFSVNDTIVILDRVRENIYKQKASETFEDTVEKSIQQTLRRSINTSFSTLLPLLSLLIFGANAIFYFVLALTVGIIIGTYSSIFIAAPLLVSWKEWSDKQ